MLEPFFAPFGEDGDTTRTRSHFSHATDAPPLPSPFNTIAFASSTKNEEKHSTYSFALEKRKGIGFKTDDDDDDADVFVFLVALLLVF